MLKVSKTELIILGGSVKPYDHERAGTKTVQFFDPRYVMFDILCFINVHCASLSCVFDVRLHCIPLCIFIVRPHCASSLCVLIKQLPTYFLHFRPQLALSSFSLILRN